jgi:23S rRNA (adenine2503-C2)-methyltransferase
MDKEPTRAVASNAVAPAAGVPDLAGVERGELERRFEAAGIAPFHARQVYRWMHRRGVRSFDEMSDLSRELRARLAREFRIGGPALVARQRSTDGTEKFLFALDDGRRIESVFIPDTPSMTFCISSQVGCAMDCAFCLTGKMGFVRNLTAGEIVGQVRTLASTLDLPGDRFNIVLMGMGEPLHNYDAVMQALRMLIDEHGFAMSPRRITLSTVGLVPAIERLMREPIVPNVAISLHGTTDAQRGAIVPINRKYPLSDLIEACGRIPLKRRDRLTFEYVLLGGVNDAPDDARRLVRLLSQLRAKVNLIPLNEAPGIPFERPPDDRVNAFAAILAKHGMTVSVRKSRGRDIRAACGQLIVEAQLQSPAQRMASLM